MASAEKGQARSDGAVFRVIIADDHAAVREGMAALFNCQPDFDVVSEACDGDEAIQQTWVLQPDAVVMDVEMPNVNGMEATRQIKRRQPHIVIVGFSLHADASVARVMAEAGADAYVAKTAPARQIVATLRQACRSGQH